MEGKEGDDWAHGCEKWSLYGEKREEGGENEGRRGATRMAAEEFEDAHS
jgi:hypothetical protein